MSNKLKIYSTLFVIAFIAVGFSNSFLFRSMGWSPAPDNKMEFAELPSEFEKRDSIPGGVVSTGVPLISYEVNVQSWGRADHKALLSTAKGQTYKVDMKKIKVSTSTMSSVLPSPFLIPCVSITSPVNAMDRMKISL